MKVLHSWLQEYIGDTIASPKDLEALLTFHSFEIDGIEEVAGEFVLDVDVLPNRSSDCLCHRGIAREIASITGVPLVHDPLTNVEELPTTDAIKISIADESACPRFSASLITGVTIAESPQWLQTRLLALGQRPINNIVDATNYVMYAIGQPLHAYDADLFPRVDGQWQFEVRFARAGEQVSLIPEGGKNEDRIVTCVGTELLIVDASSDMPIGLAGVKGGRYAGVHAGTKNIIVEAAHFHPTITRRTARRLGIVIDASKRFENEPSRILPPIAQREIIALITDIAGGACEGVLDVYLEQRLSPTVQVTLHKTNALLGLQLTTEQVGAILARIGATYQLASDQVFMVTGPAERMDLLLEEDFIEEIGRLYGLSNITSVPPAPLPVTSINVRQFYTELLREHLVTQGFSEIISSSFRAKDTIQLQNALASDKSYVRSSLLHNVKEALDQNYAHLDILGLRHVSLFEIGTVFLKTETSITEQTMIALGVRTKGDGYSAKDDMPLKLACDAVDRVLGKSLAWSVHDGVAEANLSAVLSVLPVPLGYASVTSRPPVSYVPMSPHPTLARDIALWVPTGTNATDVEVQLHALAGAQCVRVSLFDEFTKGERTSYAFRLVFQAPNRTLTGSEIDAVMVSIYTTLATIGWEVR